MRPEREYSNETARRPRRRLPPASLPRGSARCAFDEPATSYSGHGVDRCSRRCRPAPRSRMQAIRSTPVVGWPHDLSVRTTCLTAQARQQGRRAPSRLVRREDGRARAPHRARRGEAHMLSRWRPPRLGGMRRRWPNLISSPPPSSRRRRPAGSPRICSRPPRRTRSHASTRRAPDGRSRGRAGFPFRPRN